MIMNFDKSNLMIEKLILQIDTLYQEAKLSLLNPDNYEKEVDLTLVQLQIIFIDKSLTLAVNRISYLRSFICDEKSIVYKMYPLAYLKEKIIQNIHDKYEDAVKLYECCTILSPSHPTLSDFEPCENE